MTNVTTFPSIDVAREVINKNADEETVRSHDAAVSRGSEMTVGEVDDVIVNVVQDLCALTREHMATGHRLMELTERLSEIGAFIHRNDHL